MGYSVYSSVYSLSISILMVFLLIKFSQSTLIFAGSTQGVMNLLLLIHFKDNLKVR